MEKINAEWYHQHTNEWRLVNCQRECYLHKVRKAKGPDKILVALHWALVRRQTVMILWRLSVFCPWGTMKTTVIHCPQHYSMLVSWLGFHDWLDRMLCGNPWKADQWGYHYPFIRAICRSTWEVMFRNNDMGKSHADIHLRTVLNNTEVFAFGTCEKSGSFHKLLESTKKNWGSHAFFPDN